MIDITRLQIYEIKISGIIVLSFYKFDTLNILLLKEKTNAIYH